LAILKSLRITKTERLLESRIVIELEVAVTSFLIRIVRGRR